MDLKSTAKVTSLEQPQLKWGPFIATEQAVKDLWEKLQEFPQVFDDYGKDDFESFLGKIMHRNNIFIDIGPGVGLACGFAVRPRLDLVLHLVMFDRRLRGREELFMEIMDYFFQKLQLRRMTAMIADDCKTAIKLVQRLGFQLEGIMREALKRDGKLYDVQLYGILQEEFDAIYRASTTRAS